MATKATPTKQQSIALRKQLEALRNKHKASEKIFYAKEQAIIKKMYPILYQNGKKII
jgi:hypothetical protein